MSGVFRGILLGATGALGVCSQTDSLNDIPRGLLRSALSGYDMISHKHSPDSNSSNSDDLKNLSKEIAELRLVAKEGNSSKPVVIYSGSNSSGIIKVVILTTTGVVVLYYCGYGLNDIMYVTKSTLSKAVKGLEEQISYVGVKLEKTKAEIFAKISAVEESIFSTSKDLQTQIDTETGRIRGEIGKLDEKFFRIESSQDEIKLSTGQLDSRIASLQEQFDRNGAELEKANSGIRLLVNSVVELPHIRNNNGLVNDLRTYLAGYTSSWFGGQTTTDNDDSIASDKPRITGLFSLASGK